MKCRTSFFNAAIYKSCLKRYWPVWAGLGLLWILVLVLPILNMGNDLFGVSADTWLSSAGSYGGVAISFGFSIAAAMAVFSWMYNTRSTGFTAALPVKREAMFVSSWAAGYTMLAAPGILTAILCVIAGATCRDIGPAALTWLGQYLLMCLFFFGFASLCAHLTGTLWVLPAAYFVLNFAVVELWELLSLVLESLLFGYSADVMPELAADLSPIVKLFMLDWDSVNFKAWTPLLCYGTAGIVATLLGLLLKKKRRMESATDIVSVNFLKPVFRWCAAIAAALALGVVLYAIFCGDERNALAMGVFMLIGGFIGWIAAEMLVRKSYKIRSCMKTFPIFVLLLIAFVAGCANGGFGYEKRVPAAEKVERAELTYRGNRVTVTEPADIQLLRDIHQEIVDEGQGQGGAGFPLFLDYRLTNGQHMTRQYYVDELSDASIRKIEGIASRAEIVELRELLNGGQWGDISGYYVADEYEVGGDFNLPEREGREFLQNTLIPALERGEVRSFGWQWEGTAPWDEPEYFCLNLTFPSALSDDMFTYRYYEYYILPEQTELFSAMKRLLEENEEWQDKWDAVMPEEWAG